MRIGVLSRNMEYWTTRKIIKAGLLRGHETELYRTGDVQLRVDYVHFDAFHGAKSFKVTDVVIPRIIGRDILRSGDFLIDPSRRKKP